MRKNQQAEDKKTYEKVSATLDHFILLMLMIGLVTGGVRAVAGDASPFLLFLLPLVFLLFGLACGGVAAREIYTVRLMRRYKNEKRSSAGETVRSCLLIIAMTVGCFICLRVFFAKLAAF